MRRQNKRKQTKKRKNRALQGIRAQVSPATAEEFFAMPESMQELYMVVVKWVALVRQGFSRTRAMRELKLTPAQVDRFATSAFRKLKSGRYVAKAYDRLLRVVMVVSDDGLREVATRDSRQASKAGKHSAAVHRYLQTGNTSKLTQFKGKYIIDAVGERIPLLTDPEELDELGSAGVLSFESLYARSL